jgi:hypothetical protein
MYDWVGRWWLAVRWYQQQGLSWISHTWICSYQSCGSQRLGRGGISPWLSKWMKRFRIE